MTEPGRHATRPSQAAHGLLAALVGLALLLAGIFVGAVPAAAGNRVGASTPVMINTVGVSADIGAGQRLGKTVPRPLIVLATGVAAEAADDWPVISGIVRDASKSKGNFGLGSGTASQAERAGQSWVGDGYSIASGVSQFWLTAC